MSKNKILKHAYKRALRNLTFVKLGLQSTLFFGYHDSQSHHRIIASYFRFYFRLCHPPASLAYNQRGQGHKTL